MLYPSQQDRDEVGVELLKQLLLLFINPILSILNLLKYCVLLGKTFSLDYYFCHNVSLRPTQFI